MRITVHARGGLSVYGGFYDPIGDEAVLMVRDGETAALTIEYPSAPTSPSKSESGISSTTPTVSGNKLTSTLSSIQDNGYADITATVASETRKVRIRAMAETSADRYAS